MNNLLKILVLFSVLLSLTTTNAQVFSDNATNYGGNWTNGSNQGTGFGAWSLSAGSNSGSFIGNPSNNGMGTSGIGTTAFGMFATGGGFFNASRTINNGIQVGDVLTFFWAINFDAGSGSKGFDLRAGGTTIFNVNNGNSATITTTNGTANTNYGTSPMQVTLTRISATQYSFSMTSRSGGASYTTTINSTATIDNFNFYIGNQNSGFGERNMYVNAFTITKPITIANGNFNVTSTWINNTIPPADAVVTIDHNVTLNTNYTLRSITVNGGKTFTASDATPRTLTISGGGNITNNGTFTAANGTVTFAGTGTVAGTVSFDNVTIAGGVNFGTASTIASGGSLQINGGGFIVTNAPTYNAASTLIYNVNGSYDRGREWSATSGSGYPGNVRLSTNTNLNVHNGDNTQRQMAGNLTIDAGSTFTTSSMNVASQAIGVIVLGNIINNGTFTLATSADRVRCVNFTNNVGATLTLSSTVGGDLELTGSLIDNATFNSNNRAVFFTGTGTQDISGSGTFNIDYIVSNKPTGTIRLLNNLLCEGPNGGNAMTLTNATDVLDLNGFTATFGRAGVTSGLTGNGFIRGGGNSSLSLLGNGDMGSLRIDNTTPGTTNVIRNLTINRQSSGVVTLASNAIVSNAFTLTNGTFNLGIFSINPASLSGTFEMGASTTLTIGGTSGFPTNFATKTINTSSTINYNGSNQNIASSVDGVSYGNLTLSGSGTKTFANNTTINGNFTVTGVSVTAPTTLTFSGASAQNIAGINYNNIVFSGNGNKTFTSNAQVSSASNITFGSGNGTIDFDGASNNLVFTFKSDVNSTAVIGNIGSFALSGNVTTERYTKSRRAFRFITSSVTTASTINANWQEGQANPNTSTILNANTGFGTQITGTGGTANGFDTSTANGASMFGFNNNTNAWATITNTNVNTLSAGVPYRILVRGDRSISLATNASSSTPTTLRARGILRTGNFNVTATVADATDKYTFLGNPYQAPVNMETVLSNATGINPNFIYVWNSNASARGAYETINVTTSDPKKFVQPGQAFFVRNTTTSPSVTFTEASKIVDEVDETIFRNNLASENNITHLKIKLFEANALSLGEIQADQLDVRFGNFENSVDDFDAVKLVNPDEEMATVVDEIRCSYQQRTLPTIGEIIPINIKKYRHENYVFAIEVPTMQGIQIFLEDQYLNTFMAIAPDTVFLHEFSVQTGNEPSLNENRFRLVFEQIVLNNPDFATNGNIKIYPNPSNGNFNIRLPKHTDGQISIYNTLGQEIYNNKNIETELLNVQLNKIPTGTYFVKAMLDNKTYQEQIIIE